MYNTWPWCMKFRHILTFFVLLKIEINSENDGTTLIIGEVKRYIYFSNSSVVSLHNFTKKRALAIKRSANANKLSSLGRLKTMPFLPIVKYTGDSLKLFLISLLKILLGDLFLSVRT